MYLSPVTCFLSHVSWLTSPVLRVLFHVSCLTFPVSSQVSCLKTPVPCLTSFVSCLLSHVSNRRIFNSKKLFHEYFSRIWNNSGPLRTLEQPGNENCLLPPRTLLEKANMYTYILFLTGTAIELSLRQTKRQFLLHNIVKTWFLTSRHTAFLI